MAIQGLSVFSITPISSAVVQSRTKHFEQVLNFNPPNTFSGAKLSTQLSNLSLVASKRRSYVVAIISAQHVKLSVYRMKNHYPVPY